MAKMKTIVVSLEVVVLLLPPIPFVILPGRDWSRCGHSRFEKEMTMTMIIALSVQM